MAEIYYWKDNSCAFNNTYVKIVNGMDRSPTIVYSDLEKLKESVGANMRLMNINSYDKINEPISNKTKMFRKMSAKEEKEFLKFLEI